MRDVRKEVKGHDVDILYEHFKAEQEKDPDFFFEFHTDAENRLLRCFLVDSGRKKSYTYFGDVVVFHTTYNTNRYKMIFFSNNRREPPRSDRCFWMCIFE